MGNNDHLQQGIPSRLKNSVSFKVHGMSAEKKKPYRQNIISKRNPNIQLSKNLTRFSTDQDHMIGFQMKDFSNIVFRQIIERTHTHSDRGYDLSLGYLMHSQAILSNAGDP